MSNTAIEIKIEKLTSEVRDLKALLSKLMSVVSPGGRTKASPNKDNVPSGEEIMLLASEAFGITRGPDPDDDLISPTAEVKPIDWSKHA